MLKKPTEAEYAAYRKVQHYFEFQDAMCQVEDYDDLNGTIWREKLTEGDYEVLVERYDDAYDCNINENALWEAVIETYVEREYGNA